MRKRILAAFAGAAIAMGALGAAAMQPAAAQDREYRDYRGDRGPYRDRYRDMTCRELWYARNRIYADAGYCFRSERALRAFGRACFPPYGRLSEREQAEVDRIQRWEARRECRS